MRAEQRDVLRDVMLSARECETWLTLDESQLTHYRRQHLRAMRTCESRNTADSW